ncbi:MAG: thiolase family protein [Bacteroidetes bacterium]|nr:MAG: thiolase family protein [Bacteroidota bacterium]
MPDVFIASAVRTPIGRFGGAFKKHTPSDIAAAAMKEALSSAGIQGSDLDLYIFGNVLRAGHGQLIPRQAAFKAGIPKEIDGVQLDMVCSSGMMSVMQASAMIRAGDADVIMAGGVECMSNTGFFLSAKARWGYKLLMGAGEPVQDLMMRDGLTDPMTGEAMGVQTERLATEYGITRQELDEVAAASHARAAAAWDAGHFGAETFPVEYTVRRKPVMLEMDEGIRVDTTLESLGELRPAFDKNGVLTAGNSSQISDGAAAIVMASAEAVERLGLNPIARLTGGSWSAGEPWRFPEAPVPAVKKIMERLGMHISDIDLFENNEAFAINNLLFNRMLDVPMDKLNVHGGAVAIGHPIGCSGARIIVTLIHALRTRDLNTGLAAICHGTGGATAVSVERV